MLIFLDERDSASGADVSFGITAILISSAGVRLRTVDAAT